MLIVRASLNHSVMLFLFYTFRYRKGMLIFVYKYLTKV